MSARFRVVIELALACVALAGGLLSWAGSHQTVAVAPIADGQPSTTSLIYDPQLLLLAVILLTSAGVLAVAGFARLRRGRSGATPSS
ncbi:MAG TPA: hypothetical protein VGM40_13960 [Mycobacterium sp.]|jgi:hypothetical protein